MRRHILFILLLFPLLNGCIIIPTPEHNAWITGGRGRIPQKTLDLIKPGVTTREDVLLMLGGPAIVDENETTFVYCWRVVEGYLAIGGGYQGEIAPLSKMYGVTIKFDRQGIVQSCSIKHTEFFDAFFGPEEKLYRSVGFLNPTNPPKSAEKSSSLTPYLVNIKSPEIHYESLLAKVEVNDTRAAGAAEGNWKGLFGTKLGEMNIILDPPEPLLVANFLEVELTKLLKDKGIRSQQDYVCDIAEFTVEVDPNWLYTDVKCRIQLVLRHNDKQCNLSGTYTEKTLWIPDIQKVVDESFKQIAAELKHIF